MTTPHNRTSVAYDLSLFDTSAKRKEQQTPEKKPEFRVATSSVAKAGKPVALVNYSGGYSHCFHNVPLQQGNTQRD